MPPDDSHDTEPDDEEPSFNDYRITEDRPTNDGDDSEGDDDTTTEQPDDVDDAETGRSTSSASTTPTRTVDLAEHQTPDLNDEDPNAAVSDSVLEAMEQGKEAGTIREIDPENPWEDLDANADADADADDEDASSSPEQSPTQSQRPGSGTQSQSTASAGGQPGRTTTGDDLDFEGLSESEDEWSWGQSKDDVEFDYKGMHVVMSEPTDDEVLNALRNKQRVSTDAEGEASLPDEGEDGDGPNEMGQLKLYAQLAIDSPEITDERWAHGMTPTERLSIGSIAAQFIDGRNFTNTPDSGQPVQPDSSRP